MDFQRFLELVARFFEKAGATLLTKNVQYPDKDSYPNFILADRGRNTYYIAEIAYPPKYPELSDKLKGFIANYSEPQGYIEGLITSMGEKQYLTNIEELEKDANLSGLVKKSAVIIPESTVAHFNTYLMTHGVEYNSVPLKGVMTIYFFDSEVSKFFIDTYINLIGETLKKPVSEFRYSPKDADGSDTLSETEISHELFKAFTSVADIEGAESAPESKQDGELYNAPIVPVASISIAPELYEATEEPPVTIEEQNIQITSDDEPSPETFESPQPVYHFQDETVDIKANLSIEKEHKGEYSDENEYVQLIKNKTQAKSPANLAFQKIAEKVDINSMFKRESEKLPENNIAETAENITLENESDMGGDQQETLQAIELPTNNILGEEQTYTDARNIEALNNIENEYADMAEAEPHAVAPENKPVIFAEAAPAGDILPNEIKSKNYRKIIENSDKKDDSQLIVDEELETIRKIKNSIEKEAEMKKLRQEYDYEEQPAYVKIARHVWSVLAFGVAYVMELLAKDRIPKSLMYLIGGMAVLAGVYYYPLHFAGNIFQNIFGTSIVNNFSYITNFLAACQLDELMANLTVPEGFVGFLKNAVNLGFLTANFDILVMSFFTSTYYLRFVLSVGFLLAVVPAWRTFGKQCIIFTLALYFVYMPALILGATGMKALGAYGAATLPAVTPETATAYFCSMIAGAFVLVVAIPAVAIIFAYKASKSKVDLL